MINRKIKQISERNRDLSNLDSKNDHEKFLEFLKFQSLYEKIEKKEDSASKLIKKIENDALIPTIIFNEKLGGFESICKYLKENLLFSNRKISSLTSRSSKSVWQALNKAKKKYPEKFSNIPSNYYFPVSIIQNKKLSVLENVVYYLMKNYSLSIRQISLILNRDESTIWSVNNRAKRKNDKK